MTERGQGPYPSSAVSAIGHHSVRSASFAQSNFAQSKLKGFKYETFYKESVVGSRGAPGCIRNARSVFFLGKFHAFRLVLRLL
jgi:hypothetical protein